MKFESKKVAFGRHESFSLRFGWLTKGFQAFADNPEVFTESDSVVTLGVGKNMVGSIRHWLRAAQLVDLDSSPKAPKKLGKILFSKSSGVDPYLEDEATIWLIHWLIATNPQQATSWYWFFNYFHKPEFKSQEVANALVDFAKEKIEVKSSVTTIKNDCAVLLRSYVQGKTNNKSPVEEALDSPLSLLRLITYSPVSKSYQSKLNVRDNLPLGVLGYAICDFLQQKAVTEIPIEELMYGKNGYVAPGLVFRLTESAFLTKLEQLVNYIPGVLKLDETAGIHQLYCLSEIDPIKYLETHYNATILEGYAA